MKIESTDQDVRNLLSSGYYRIPRFQRPYSWTSENVQDFWEDVTNNPGDNYFIGSMVMFKDGNQRYGVVDGQQRLTTITILLAALRDKLKEVGLTDLATGIQNQIEKKNIDNKPEYILSTETSYPFFQDRILKFESPEVEKHGTNEEDSLKVAYDFFNEKLSELIEQADSLRTLTPSERKEHLQPKLVAIRDAVLGLKVILVKLDSEDDAYIIFETLNTRGKDLNLSDLVKNHITKHLKARNASIDSPTINWGQLLSTLEGSSADLDVDTFIHHFWLSRYEYLASKRVFKGVKQRIGKNEAKEFLNALVSDAKLYRWA